MHGLALRTGMVACLLAVAAVGLPTATAGQDRPDEAVLFSIGGFKRLTADARGHTAVRVVCEDHTACTGTLRLSVAPTRRPLLGQVQFEVPPGAGARLRFTLSRSARRLLAKKRKLAVLATANVVDGAGNLGFAELPTTLALVKKRR